MIDKTKYILINQFNQSNEGLYKKINIFMFPIKLKIINLYNLSNTDYCYLEKLFKKFINKLITPKHFEDKLNEYIMKTDLTRLGYTYKYLEIFIRFGIPSNKRLRLENLSLYSLKSADTNLSNFITVFLKNSGSLKINVNDRYIINRLLISVPPKDLLTKFIYQLTNFDSLDIKFSYYLYDYISIVISKKLNLI